jgi:hypothetical protein
MLDNVFPLRLREANLGLMYFPRFLFPAHLDWRRIDLLIKK